MIKLKKFKSGLTLNSDHFTIVVISIIIRGRCENEKNIYCSQLALSMLTIVGCSNVNSDSDYVYSGFSISDVSGEPTPWLSTAIKAKKKQESIVSFTVYAGYCWGFIDKWNDNAFGTNLGYGKFVLQRVIKDRNDIDISIHNYDLPNFDDESKYLVNVQGAEDGSDMIVSRSFTFNFENTINLDEITIEQGCVLYDICLVDDNDQVIVENLQCGISLGYLYFQKLNNQIFFSNTERIFNE